MKNKALLGILLTAVVLVASWYVLPRPGRPVPTDPSPPLYSGYLKFGNPPDPTVPGWVAERANFNFLCYSGNAWRSPRMKAAADTLRQLNPGIQLGEYASTMAIGQWNIEAVRRKAGAGWAQDYYNAVMPYLARTNQMDPVTGQPDTASIFLRNYSVNLLLPGAIESLVAFHVQYSSNLDWLLLDFMTIPMPDFRAGQGPRYVSEQAGEMDLDQDGVAHAEDMDERTALRLAFMQLLRELHAALPKVKLIPNGQLVMIDDEVALLTDGCYVEGFPQWFFGEGYNFENAMFRPSYRPSMWSLTAPRYRNGLGFVMIEDRYHQMKHGSAAAMFPQAVEIRRNDDTTDSFIPDETRALRVELGPAAGPATCVADTLRRPFKHGVYRLVLNPPSTFYTRLEVQP
jgi:hypothetical protein